MELVSWRSVTGTMRRACPVFGLLIAACVVRTPPPPPQPALLVARPQVASETRALEQADQILEQANLGNAWIGGKQRLQLAKLGLDTSLASAALRELVRACIEDSTACTRPKLGKWKYASLVSIVSEHGTPEVLVALIQLDGWGLFTSRAVERILLREAQADANTCAPPGDDEIAKVSATLNDFLVLDAKRDRLVARKLSADELADLAYFYAGIGTSVADAGKGAARGARGRGLNEAEVKQRGLQLAALGVALERGQLDAARRAALSYLTSLGYPGPLDASREADRAWGGARFSYVMRDLALVSEVVGEFSVAADLYQRADPGGGACGTSRDSQRGTQIRGMIRVYERAGECRKVVAHRLLDWENDYNPEKLGGAKTMEIGYGPGRLVASGWDVARMYRGALLTRNRGDEGKLRKALRRYASRPDRAAALDRLARQGTEHWEWRVRAAEGLADVVGRQALDPLVGVMAQGDRNLRQRTMSALGDMAERNWTGPCPGQGFAMFGVGSSNIWSRTVSRFGLECATQLDDAAADGLAARLLPYASDGDMVVRNATVAALGKLAAPSSGRRIDRWNKRASAALRAACDPREQWSQKCQDARLRSDATAEAANAWHEVHDPH